MASVFVLAGAASAAQGDLDPTFNSDGKLTSDFGNFGTVDGAADLVIQPDGKIIVAGRTGGFGDLARYDANGTLDPTFGSNGSSASSGVAIAAMALQADGKIVVVGGDVVIGTGVDFAVARFNGNGSLDDGSATDSTPGDSFGTAGRVTTDFGDDDSARSVAIQPDGKIVVVGHRGATNSGFNVNFAIARYNVNGSLDDGSANDSTPGDSFGTAGGVTTDFAGDEDVARDVVIQPDGKIVVAGSREFNGVQAFAVARYLPDGMPDNSFDTDGRLSTTLNGDAFANAVALQSNGKIVVAGAVVFRFSDSNFAIARYNSNGTADTTFGPNSNGLAFADFNVNGEDQANDLVLQSDGKIIAAGYEGNFNSNGANFAVARWLPNGTLDSTFGTAGLVSTIFGEFDGDFSAFINGVALQSDGRIVAAGSSRDNQFTTADVVLARYLATTLNSDVVRVKSFSLSGGIPTVTVDSHTGYSFKLQVADSLDASAFTTFGSPQQGSNGSTLTFVGPPATPPAEFYRVVIEPLNF